MTFAAPPRATYRLQLTKDFSFRRAGALAPYLHQLGISHAYLSPVLKARRGSTHGYDTVDHSLLNPELGTRSEFEEMAETFRHHEIGIVLDIVPNHMGIGGEENPLWLDILEWGPSSRYARWFDINWSLGASAVTNKILLPFLGGSMIDALERDAIKLRYDAATQSFAIWAAGTHKLPLRRDTYQMIPASPAGVPLDQVLDHLNSPGGRAELVAIMQAQHWQLTQASATAENINYRRFFAVSDLAGIRVEIPEVFDHVHGLIFEFVEQGLVQGLRIDHVDGLYDPKAYLLALRQKAPRPVYLVVEKILAPNEALRRDWGVDGTTGYEFSALLTRLLVDPSGDRKLTHTYKAHTGEDRPFAEIEREAKLAVIDLDLAAELESLTLRLRAIALDDPTTSGPTGDVLRSALRAFAASMPVYRTYVDGKGAGERDRRFISVAIARARRQFSGIDPAVFDFIHDVVTGDLGRDADGPLREAVLDTARRVQQFTGPVMAKGLEDTALYRYNRLIALSDVGHKPDRLSGSVAAFHDFNVSRRATMPLGMLTTSSHDSKRGEDARARIAALSGYADEWSVAVMEWTDCLERAGAPDIDPADRYYFFQLLLGAWPPHLSSDSPVASNELEVLRGRLNAAMQKSLREARLRTNWATPDAVHEAAIAEFVSVALRRNGEFMESFRRFDRTIGVAGAHNGLIETVLKMTVPGVPDIYQGAEFWEQSMVDPDNRRPVNFVPRMEGLERRPAYADLAEQWQNGHLKQRIIVDMLACRRQYSELFSHGSYEPVETSRDDICAFIRELDDTALLVAVQLYPRRFAAGNVAPLELPTRLLSRTWRAIVPDEPTTTSDLLPHALFARLPFAVLLSDETR